MNQQTRDEGSGSQPDNSNSADAGNTAAGASDQTADDGEKNPIPYNRFKEVNDEKKQAQERILQLESQQQAQNQQMQQMAYNQQQMFQQQQEPAEPQTDPNIERVKDILGRDEMGMKAFEAMDMLTEAKLKSAGQGIRADVINEVNGTVNQRIGGVTASLQTKQQINQMVTEGRITADVGATLQTQVEEAVNQYPQWANSQPMLVNTLLGDMYSRGTLQQPATQSNNNMPGTPFQPGGDNSGGNGSSSLQRDAEQLKRFPSLRNKTDKELRSVIDRVKQEANNV